MHKIVQTRQFDHGARTTYIRLLDSAPMSSTTSGMGHKQEEGRTVPECLRTASSWMFAALLLLTTACGFPRPADVGDDASMGCMRDQDCSNDTPFCVDAVCAVCRTSTSCPASRPVCDTTSHDCRTCSKDSECDSGACDLAGGTCVSQGAILYASPTGSTADPCTKTTPCSIQHAAELVDMAHSYIVLLPGRYEDHAGFVGKAATIVGNHATIASGAGDTSLRIYDGSSITMRDIQLEEHAQPSDTDFGVIQLRNSKLILDDMQSDTQHLDPVYGEGGDTLTIRRSTVTGPSVRATKLIADRCFFHSGGPGVTDSIELTNSVIISDSSSGNSGLAININSTVASSDSKILNNTVVAGRVSCSVPGHRAQFTNNIFYNYTSIDVSNNCAYQYNLVTPAINLGGNGNTTGDPMFVDMAHGDFHLKAGSVAIDAADPAVVSIDRDYDGTHRPQGTRSDIGAFEYVP